MQTSIIRTFVLVAVLLSGAALYPLVGETHSAAIARWPGSDVHLEAENWSTGPLSVDQASTDTAIVSRVFSSQSGATATLSLVTSGTPKLYAAGAEVPFLGSGYQVETPSRDLVPADDNVRALVARRGAEEWLVLYAYGERRGLLGNGALAWGFAVLDGLAGRQNDYYKMYLVAGVEELDATAGRDVAKLAGAIFPQVARWYAGTPA
ncbi:MAG: hypothetical protein JOZ81_19820 [Chloroflexi bacterium]|nr:hypothetical protein [Chloroflexota bacterium]